jgi:hypothetical protein
MLIIQLFNKKRKMSIRTHEIKMREAAAEGWEGEREQDGMMKSIVMALNERPSTI